MFSRCLKIGHVWRWSEQRNCQQAGLHWVWRRSQETLRSGEQTYRSGRLHVLPIFCVTCFPVQRCRGTPLYVHLCSFCPLWESTSIVLLSDWVRVMTGRHWRPRDASQVTTLAEVPVLKGKYNSGASWYPRTETEMGSAPGGEGHHQHVQTLPSQTTVEVVQGGRNLGF